MSDMIDINPQRTAELETHRAVVEPILRGLNDKILTNLSTKAKAVLQGQIDVVQRRLNLVYDELGQDREYQHGPPGVARRRLSRRSRM